MCMLAACPFPANHGTPGSIREMAEAISALGHEVHVVTYHFGEDIPVKGPRLHRISPWTNESRVVVGPTSRRPLYDLQMVFKTLEVIRKHRPHVLHAHGYEAALAAWLCRAMTGVPVVYSGHNTMADELPTYGFIRPQWMAKALARLLDAVVPRLGDRCVPHSSNIERFFHRMGLQARTEAIVNFGIDVDGMADGDGAEVRRRYGLSLAPVVVYSGVLDEFQRLDLLLEALQEVSHWEPRVRLLLVRTIPHAGHEARLRHQAEALGVAGKVVLTEPQPLEEVRHFLAAADVAVVPRPDAPGFPIKLLNYMAAGRPCVLFASSATSGLVDGENVRLANPDTAAALGAGILDLLRDSETRLRLGRNGQRYVRANHDRCLIAQRVCEAYARTLLAAGRRVPAPPRSPCSPHCPPARAGPAALHERGGNLDSPGGGIVRCVPLGERRECS